jgi:hypothetical protein
MEEVEDVLNRLNRLGVAIRQSSRGSFSAKVERFARGTNTSLIEHITTRIVHSLYPDAHSELRDRLSKSMVERYSVMLYQKSRQSTLQTRRNAPGNSMPTINENVDESEAREHEHNIADMNQPTKPDESDVVSIQQVLLKPSVPPSISDLSTLNTTRLRQALKHPFGAGSHRSKASTVHVHQTGYPKEPTKKSDTSSACEWCSEPLNQSLIEGSGWRCVYDLHSSLCAYYSLLSIQCFYWRHSNRMVLDDTSITI